MNERFIVRSAALALLGTFLTGVSAITGVTLDGTMGPRAVTGGSIRRSMGSENE